MVTARPFIFNKKSFILPRHLYIAIGRDSHRALSRVFHAASRASKYLNLVEGRRSFRFRAMSPLKSLKPFLDHAKSVDRLMNWAEDHKVNNPTLAPSEKFSPDLIKFNVDQRAYDEYANQYNELLKDYIKRPYQKWLDAKADMGETIAAAGLSDSDYKDWLIWWNEIFLSEMTKWEDQLEGLVLPSWEETIDYMHEAILDRVENPEALASEFYRNCGI